MSVTSTVTPEDVLVELGRPTPPTATLATQIGSWIQQAIYLIGKRAGSAAFDQSDVDYVVLQAVAAHARQPENVTQVDVSVDDGQVSKRYSTSQGRVAIWDDLWSLLEGDGATAEAFAIDPAYTPDVCDPWRSW